MKNMLIVIMAAALLSGCSFIMQDGAQMRKYYGIRGDDAVVLTQQITTIQDRMYGLHYPSADMPQQTVLQQDAPVETPSDLKGRKIK